MQQKKRKLLTTAGIIILFASAGFFLSYLLQILDEGRTADSFKKYLLNDLNIVQLDESGRGPLYDFYLYNLVGSHIKAAEVDDFDRGTDLAKYEKRAKDAETLFLTQCDEARPENCHPLWSIMPYCMSQWVKEKRMPVMSDFDEQAEKSPVFIKIIGYWREHLDEKEWQKDDLDAVLGFAISEYLCGDLQNINVEKWSEKTIRAEMGALDLSGEIKYDSRKIQTLIHLHGRVNAHDRINTITDMPPYAGLKELCVMPSKEMVSAGDVCDLFYYYRNKVFCEEELAIDHQTEKYLKERHSNPEKLLCQIGLWQIIHGRI